MNAMLFQVIYKKLSCSLYCLLCPRVLDIAAMTFVYISSECVGYRIRWST